MGQDCPKKRVGVVTHRVSFTQHTAQLIRLITGQIRKDCLRFLVLRSKYTLQPSVLKQPPPPILFFPQNENTFLTHQTVDKIQLLSSHN